MISFVIPAKDEAESLPRLHGELAAVADAEELEIEILFIDDGSTDGTWEAIQAISASDPRVRGIRFRRNFGKAAGLSAGFAEARGQIIFTMDADLQDDPAEVPRFLKALDGGLDVVSGWKRTRHDPWHKVLPSRAWNAMVSWATGVSLHDHNCGFKAYRRAVIEEVDVYGEFHRYIPPLARARGFRVGEVEVHHRPREHGSSKYGARRFVRGFIDLLTVVLLTKARHRPAHLFGGWGLSFIALSAGLVLLWLICAAGGWIPRARGVIGWIGGLGMGLGITFLAMGLLAQMMLAVGGGGRDQFAVVERIGEPDPED